MKTFIGTVTSSKMNQTAVVVVRRRFPHPLYKKYLTRDKKYHVHNTLNAQEGDRVKFTPTRPLSKTKRWKIIEILSSPSS
jgi:small subunit ribosomal protein S17